MRSGAVMSAITSTSRPRESHGLTASCLGDRSTLPFDRSEQHARTLHWRMPMRLSPLRIDDGANTLGCLPLQRMPAPIRQRLRHVHAAEERRPDSDRPDEASYAYRRQWQRGDGCVLSRVRSPHLSCSEVRTGRAFLKPGTLDDTSWLRPGYFVWMKSAQGWVPVPNDVTALEGQ